jgi:hypothetical protein
MAQVVEHLLSKCEVLSSNSSTAKTPTTTKNILSFSSDIQGSLSLSFFSKTRSCYAM